MVAAGPHWSHQVYSHEAKDYVWVHGVGYLWSYPGVFVHIDLANQNRTSLP